MKKYLTYITSLMLLLSGAYTSQAQITLDTEPVSCDGSTKGKITVSVGISGNFEYSLDGGAFQSSSVFDNLDEGNYMVTVKEVDLMCEFSKSTTVDKEGELSVSVSGGGTFQFCTQDGPPDVTLTENASVQVVVIPIVCSRDPNDMIGPPGYGEPKWVSINDVLPYTIRFENDPEFATAPAQKVVIEHIPDADLNLFSLKLSDFGFANLFFQVPPNSTYYTNRLDVVDSLGVYVDVTAGIDVTENKIFWIFESIDAETGLEPSDPLAGLLPVNDTITRAGEGFVTFTIQPKITSQTGDTIFAVSDIIFDLNEIIATPEIFNVIDAYPPVSQMDTLPLVSEDTVILSWTAMDDEGGCGVGFYDIYVSEDGAPYSLYYAGITEQSYPFIGISGRQYDFFVQAVDNVGNREALKNAAETTTLIGGRTQFDLTVLLEGAYSGNGMMSADLNALSLIPNGQPYNTPPWNYQGTETANNIGINTVDWVLVTIRTDLENTSVVDTAAALLQNDGKIISSQGGLLTFDVDILDRDSIYVAVYHRNHVGVMSAAKVARNDITFTYDFTPTANNAFGSVNGVTDLGDGYYGLISGDADANGQVQTTDFNQFVQDLGLSGYLPEDFNLNSQVQNTDLQNLFIPNVGRGASFEY